MASLWRKSQEVIRDNNDARATGAKAYFYQAGTTTPLTVYSDNGLTTPRTQPVSADAYARMPSVFLAIGTSYKERVETSGGSLLWEVDNVDPAPYQPAVGGGTVDSDDLLDVGVVLPFFQTGAKTGWVRCNGRTIGNASSAATERANADTEDLFTYLWNNVSDTYAPVSTGRGASAAADYAANKTIGLPDLRGRVMAGLDDMGNSAASRFSGFTFASGAATTLLSNGGAATITLDITMIPSHNHGGTVAASGNTPTSTIYGTLDTIPSGTGASYTNVWRNTATTSIANYTHDHTISSQGGGAAHANMPPFALVTWYIKLKRETV